MYVTAFIIQQQIQTSNFNIRIRWAYKITWQKKRRTKTNKKEIIQEEKFEDDYLQREIMIILKKLMFWRSF